MRAPAITFLYPSMSIGGAQLLFARLAMEIAVAKKGKVIVVDYVNGFIRDFLKNTESIEFIDYYPGVALPWSSVVITPLSNLAELRYMLSSQSLLSCNYLFWSIHPDNIKHILYSSGRKFFWRKNKLRKNLADLASSGAIIFMDEANEFAFEKEVGSVQKAIFVPIPIEIKEVASIEVNRNKEAISVAWLGRLSYDKINSLKKIINDIVAFQAVNKIEFYVIGDGPEDSALRQYAKATGVALHSMGVLQGAALSNFLRSKIDIGIAMGTSCLEIGALRIPVALVDYSLNQLPEDSKYDWIYDTKKFTLGNNASWGKNRDKTLVELIAELRDDSLNEIGDKCYDYISRGHSLTRVADALIYCVKSRSDFCHAGINDVERMINPRPHEFLYRVVKGLKRMYKYFFVSSSSFI